MANSGIEWIDIIFNFCVRLLYDVANILGISYEEINVWLFCVIWPILNLVLFAEVIRLRIKNEQLIKNRKLNVFFFI
jgi:hypothetical protein